MRRAASRPRLAPLQFASVLLAALTVAGACSGGLTAGGLGSVAGAETPRPSAGTAGQAAVAALREAVAAGGFDLAPATRSWQPAQPAGLLTVPRSAYQVQLADPDDGVVLVYEFATPELAAEGADELADYLSSGPGRINYPGDTVFHVGQVGPAIILAWYAASAATDPEAAAAAFERVATVGSAVPVRP